MIPSDDFILLSKKSQRTFYFYESFEKWSNIHYIYLTYILIEISVKGQIWLLMYVLGDLSIYYESVHLQLSVLNIKCGTLFK